VSALVTELEALGLLFETEPDPTNTVGRPSPTVQVSPGVVGIAVNPEVDAVTIGVVGLGGKVLKRIRYETDHAPSVREAVNISAAVIEGLRGELEANHTVVGVGIAVPGLVRSSDGLVRWAPHLEWTDEPVATMLAEATGFPVAAGNDATLGAIAELTFGAGRGKTELIYLNGGASGIGGGVIAAGRPLGGAGGYAGEFGHIRVDNTDATYNDAESGTLESLVNRAALVEALGLPSVDADVLEAALLASNDPHVKSLVHRQLEFLSTSLRNAVNVLNPQVIVLGGFLATIFSAEPDFLRERVRAQSLGVSFEGVEITTAKLGSDLLMIGAAELAFAPLLADPAGVARS
jgi:predicted NBD/HSP70 family sugar kinase